MLRPHRALDYLGPDASNLLDYHLWNYAKVLKHEINKGLDLDNDIESYDFYIGVQDENLNLEKEDLSTSQISIQLDSNSTYFWQIRTTDKSNNSSYSKIFSFETQ